MNTRDALITVCLMLVLLFFFLDLRRDYAECLIENDLLRQSIAYKSVEAESRIYYYLEKKTIQNEEGKPYLYYVDGMDILRGDALIEQMASDLAIDILFSTKNF